MMTEDYIKELKESAKAVKNFRAALDGIKYPEYGISTKHNKARKLRFIAKQKKKKKR
jgi:hypothetical protein